MVVSKYHFKTIDTIDGYMEMYTHNGKGTTTTKIKYRFTLSFQKRQFHIQFLKIYNCYGHDGELTIFDVLRLL